MNAKILAALPLLAVFGFTAATLHAAGFNKATITRLEKDVKVLKENAAPRAAVTGDSIDSVTSVATGASSRAELQFPDKSLTRLGANSRFTLRGTGHTIDLDKGVLLLEVPERLRDAKVRTAAVTAAVTGGTIIVEYLPGGFMKILCAGGDVDVVSNFDKSQFVHMHAGQMIIQPVNAKIMSTPVDFDMALFLKTCKLLTKDDPDAKAINDALTAQQAQIGDGELVKTNLVIPGLGTIVQFNNNARLEVFTIVPPPGTPPPPPGGAGGGTQTNTGNVVPVFDGVVPLIVGTTVLNAHGSIQTDPTVTAFNSITGTVITSNGVIYHPATDGPFPYFGFGSLQIGDPDLHERLVNSGDWGAFKFEKLLINGTPNIDTGGNIFTLASLSEIPQEPSIPNLILSALGNIDLSADNQFSTGEGSPGETTSNSFKTKNTNLEAVLLFSENGNITVGEGFQIKANNQEFTIVAAGAASDITIQGDIKIYNGTLLASAGQDVNVDSNVTADAITFRAGRDVVISGTGGESEGHYVVEAKKGKMLVSAKRNIHVTNSAELKALCELSQDALLRLESQQGDITIDGNSTIRGTNVEIEAFQGNISFLNSVLTATHALKARTLGPNGTLTIDGSTLNAGLTSSAGDLIRLYADGANGSVLFRGNVVLNSDEVQIAGKTVQVDSGGVVKVLQGNAHVFSDHHNYNIPNFGNIDSANLQQYNFNHASKPDFKTGGKLGRPSS